MHDGNVLSDLATHEVANQAGPLGDFDAWASDTALREAVAREGPPWVADYAARLGAELGRRHWFQQGETANRYPPELHAFDSFGRRADWVAYHPAYHALMQLACEAGAHAVAWTASEGGHVAQAAALYLLTQPEQGFCCPLVMTHAAVPALRCEPAVADDWLPGVLASAYDPRDAAPGAKQALTLGMAMTEKQGGSDVRANTTRARPSAEGGYELTGHKWFCSAPMSDGFLTLAQTDAGLTCFLLPRRRSDGGHNRVFLQRLKDKCGNRANASAELELDRALAQRVGDEGGGVRTIIEMVHETRLATAIAPVGMLRQALVQVHHHLAHRTAFGRPLLEQPLMRQVVADLALELEANLVLVMRLACAFDQSGDAEHERLIARIGTPIAKYWSNKRAPQAVYEAMECLGGNGYIEESLLARLYREAPVNSIWEGSGNVVCLDVLRAMAREPEIVPAILRELNVARGRDDALDRLIETIETELTAGDDPEPRARNLVETLARAWQAALLLERGHDAVAAGFCNARLRSVASSYGAVSSALDADALLARLWPY